MSTPGTGRARTLFVALILVLLLAAAISVTYTRFTTRYPGANDFYPRWVGGCALLCKGQNPYSEAVTLRIQQGIYGRPALPGEDRVAFAYPVYSLLFFFPLCATENYALVQAIWFWLLLAVWVASVILTMRVVQWHPPPWLWALTILWSVLLYPAFRALILGQFSVWVVLAMVAALWAMQHRRDGWAGVLLAFTTVKPQLIYLAIPWILIWAAGQRRWRLWAGFFAATAALAIGGMLLLPSWLPDFVRQVRAYPSYTVFGSLTWIVVRHGLGLGRAAEIVVWVALGLLAVGLGGRLWRGTWEQMLWMLGWLLLLTHFYTPRIATTHYVLLVPWILWGFRQLQRGGPRWGRWGVVAAQAILLVGPWALFLATLQGDFEQAAVYWAFPAAMLVILIVLWIPIRPAAQPAAS
jgi:hypothetical protein